MKPKAVVLLSGGLDSANVLAIAISQGFEPYCMSFDYGQRHKLELECSRQQANLQQAKKHIIVPINLGQFGGSALTDDIEVPKDRTHVDLTDSIPITYVPARNTVFLSLALGWAEVLGASDIFVGVNALDYSGYPDCRPEFIAAFEAMANVATKAAVEGQKLRIHAPLINLTKAQIIAKGLNHSVDYSCTTSCYDPLENGAPCRRCDSCQLREKGFYELGMEDPRVQLFS